MVQRRTALPITKHDAQGIGSAISYGKRYGLQAIVGIPSEDDDGNNAAKNAPAKKIATDMRPQSPSQFNIEAFDSMDEEFKDFIRTHAMELIAMHEDKKPLAQYVTDLALDTDEKKMALWSQLPSKVRTAITEEKKKAVKPTPA